MKMPKQWQESLCAQCRWFHCYPIDDDWEWECYHPEEYFGLDISTPISNDEECEGFEVEGQLP